MATLKKPRLLLLDEHTAALDPKTAAKVLDTTEKIVQAVAPTKREEMPPLKVTMLEEDLRPFFPDKRTTIPDKSARPKPDLMKRDFTSLVPTYKLVGDITYLRTGEG